MLRENFKNIVYQSVAQIIPRAMLFIFGFYLAKTLGAAEYGKYDFALSFGYLIGVFFELGGNVILTKYIARGQYSSFRFSLKFRAVTIILTFTIVFSFLLLTGIYKEILLNITFASLGIAFSSLMNLYFAFFRGVKQMNYEAVVLIIQKVLFIGLALIIFIYRKDSTVALLSFLISMFVCWQIIQLIFIRKKDTFKEDKEHEDIQLKAYFKDVMSLALVEVFSIVYFRVTQIILEQYGGFEQVGVYSASYKLVEAFTNIPSILMIVLFPAFAKLGVENISEFKIQFKKILLLMVSLGFIACVLCWFGGQTFYKFIGKDYNQSYLIVRYMTIALFAIYPNYLLTQSLIALDQNLKYASVVFTALVMNVIIALLAVPVYGAIGSALSVGICEVLIFIMCYILIKRTLKQVEFRKA